MLDAHHRPSRLFLSGVTSIAALALAACSGSSSPSQTTVDASHPPAPIQNGQQAAPANLCAALLTPADLGSSWRAAEDPPTTYGTPPPFAVGPPAVYRITTSLQTEHWTGSAWTTDQTVEELATSYGSAANADRAVQLELAQGRGGYRSARIHGITVFTYESKDPTANRQIWFAFGPLAVKLTVGMPPSGAPGAVSEATAVGRAIQRLQAHPVS